MTDRVHITVDLENLKTILRLSRECAEDLVLEIEDRYQGDHPVTIRRRNRDLEAPRLLMDKITKTTQDYLPLQNLFEPTIEE
ncbi:MAG: hypothetical protein GY941_13135 [Planctomycetes bacterium]|nr:hypothetical protein [Planctomycetota bacterium]